GGRGALYGSEVWHRAVAVVEYDADQVAWDDGAGPVEDNPGVPRPPVPVAEDASVIGHGERGVVDASDGLPAAYTDNAGSDRHGVAVQQVDRGDIGRVDVLADEVIGRHWRPRAVQGTTLGGAAISRLGAKRRTCRQTTVRMAIV